jgi:hypothetical protein
LLPVLEGKHPQKQFGEGHFLEVEINPVSIAFVVGPEWVVFRGGLAFRLFLGVKIGESRSTRIDSGRAVRMTALAWSDRSLLGPASVRRVMEDAS